MATVRQELAKHPSVMCAWYSAIRETDGNPTPCIAIVLEPQDLNQQGVLRSIVDSLLHRVAEIPQNETKPTGLDVMRDEILGFSYVLTDQISQAELAQGAGVRIYPDP